MYMISMFASCCARYNTLQLRSRSPFSLGSCFPVASCPSKCVSITGWFLGVSITGCFLPDCNLPIACFLPFQQQPDGYTPPANRSAQAMLGAGLLADKLIKQGWHLTRVRKTLQTVAFLGPALALIILSRSKDPKIAVACMTCALGITSLGQLLSCCLAYYTAGSMLAHLWLGLLFRSCFLPEPA